MTKATFQLSDALRKEIGDGGLMLWEHSGWW